MNLNLILKRNKIESLTYNSSLVERPMAALVDFDYKKILEKPPENTSVAVQKELKLIAYETANRRKQDYDLIYRMDQDMDSFFEDFLKSRGFPYPQSYINKFYSIVEPILMNTKNYWNRPRPSQLAMFYDIKIDRIVTNTINTASYPSGHTVYSQLVANILSDIYPSLSNELNDIAQLTGMARVKQGVHYPSDNKASIIFSNYVFLKLKNKL